jgi:hypothetical protein
MFTDSKGFFEEIQGLLGEEEINQRDSDINNL